MKIDFTLEQLSVLDKAIQQLPYYIAAPLIQSINTQISQQQEIMDTPLDESNLVFPNTHQQNSE